MKIFWDHEITFEKLYNFISNLCLDSECPDSFRNAVLEISWKRLEGKHGQMFLVNYAHLLEKGLVHPYMLQRCNPYRTKILDSLKRLPIMAKTKGPIIRRLLFPDEPRPKRQLDAFWNQSKVGDEMKLEITEGIKVSRFHPGGSFEPGEVFITNDKLKMVFLEFNKISFDPVEDVLECDEFVKLEKGFDAKKNSKPFQSFMAKHNKKIQEDCCVCIYGRKTKDGESGFYLCMDSKKQRDSWVDTLNLISKENVQRLKAIKKK